jgi:protein Tex
MSETTTLNTAPILAQELELPETGVTEVIELLKTGNSVPFIARYRKEVTGGLDEVEIRNIEERNNYLIEIEGRRTVILESIEQQGKLTEELKNKILAQSSKSALEDLYLPYKPKRRTRATIAREKGLLPLAERILEQPAVGDPEAEAAAFIDTEKKVESTADALAGARDIVAEIVTENADIRAMVREIYSTRGKLASKTRDADSTEPTKFEQYYDYAEEIATIPSHRYLAIRRGEREGVLRICIEADPEAIIPRIERMMNPSPDSPFAEQLALAVTDSYKRLLSPSIETEVLIELKMSSDRYAVDVFAGNLRNLLLSSPLGGQSVIGIDPGIRTGCKCAAVDTTGKYLETITVYPNRSGETLEREQKKLLDFIKKHNPVALAIGNGTYGRETEAFARTILRAAGSSDDIIVIAVNESGASVYSASDIAREEFPDLDLTIRGAISIARRLQDPLAEYVKIDPKAIGVGQYQHDVHQPLLHRKLGEVTESCVNFVGVELNTASAPLLSQVAGIGTSLAKKIITHRENEGAFRKRSDLMSVSGLGPHAFEQAAGFLRVAGSPNPLDASAVHPERYELVERIATDMGVSLTELIGNTALVDKIDISRYIDETVGEPTLRDIIAELKKPGRDPRADFEAPKFLDGVFAIGDLKQGMRLEGVVTNVTAFGAFVDIGVHQDGLVHISQLADRFVKDPQDIVSVGQKLKVRVLEIDLQRKRIALSAKSESSERPVQNSGDSKPRRQPAGKKRTTPATTPKQPQTGSSLADLKNRFKKH